MKFNSRDMKFTLKFLCQKKEEEHKINVNIVRFAQPVTFVRLRLHHNLLDVTNLKRSCHSA